jgi:hypothetical protein
MKMFAANLLHNEWRNNPMTRKSTRQLRASKKHVGRLAKFRVTMSVNQFTVDHQRATDSSA